MNKINEATRRELLDRSKNAEKTKSYGTTRYERRNRQHIYNSVNAFNKIDFNALFKGNMLSFKVPVHGETDNYEVEVLFDKVCDDIKREVKNNKNKFEYKCVYRAIVSAINRQDIYIACTCPDWCLDGATKIKLLNGEVYTIEELKSKFDSGDDIWVYSTDSNGDFKPGHVSDVWVSGFTNDFVKITLDNDKEIITTPNHRYMLRDGSYIEAKDLIINQSLMPLYFSEKGGYETVKLNSKPTTSFYSVYKLVANELLQNEIQMAKDRTGEDVISIHHKDFNKSNNYPTNLYPMGHQEHYRYHYEHVKESGCMDKWLKAGRLYWSTDEARSKQALVAKEVFWGDNGYYNNRTDEEVQRDFELHSNGIKLAWDRGCFDTEAFKLAAKKRGEFLRSDEIVKLSAEGVRNYWNKLSDDDKLKRAEISRNNSRVGWSNKHNEIIIKKIGRVINDIINAKEIPSPETYNKYKKCQSPKWSTMFNTWDDVSEYFNLNHKVKSVEVIHLDESEPVYDLTVDNYNNFYVDAGVILHNCYRFAYWSTKGRFNGGKPEVRVADITNPNNNKGAGCKHTMAVLGNLDWAMKLATSITNYVEYMQEQYEDKFKRLIFPVLYDISYEEFNSSGDDELENTVDIEEIPEDEE